jgi:hypothetical protein
VTRQNLKDRDIAVALGELSGKLTIAEIRDHLKARGLLSLPDDFQNSYECDLARKAIGRVRKFKGPGGEAQMELVNLYEWSEDGTRSQYYRHVHELTPDEGVKLCTYWHDNGRRCDRRLMRYVKTMTKIHGKKFQKLLPFELPALQAATV